MPPSEEPLPDVVVLDAGDAEDGRVGRSRGCRAGRPRAGGARNRPGIKARDNGPTAEVSIRPSFRGPRVLLNSRASGIRGYQTLRNDA